MDKDGDGQISLDEFKDILRLAKKNTTMATSPGRLNLSKCINSTENKV